MKQKKKTLSQTIEEINKQDNSHMMRAVDIISADQQDIMAKLIATANEDAHKYHGNDFFVVILTRQEESLRPPAYKNLISGEWVNPPPPIRNQIISKATCPTPAYAQTVFRVRGDNMDFIWVIPDKQTCHYILEYQDKLPDNEHELLSFVQRFSTGDLGKLCNELNGEKQGSEIGELIKKTNEAVGELKKVGKEWHVIQS